MHKIEASNELRPRAFHLSLDRAVWIRGFDSLECRADYIVRRVDLGVHIHLAGGKL